MGVALIREVLEAQTVLNCSRRWVCKLVCVLRSFVMFKAIVN